MTDIYNPPESEIPVAPKRSKLKSMLRRAYITWLWILIPFIGLPFPPEIKDGVMLSAGIFGTLCAFVAMFYPTDRKIIFVPISWLLFVTLIAIPALLKS